MIKISFVLSLLLIPTMSISAPPCPSDPSILANELIEQELEGKGLPEAAAMRGCLDPGHFKYTTPTRDYRKSINQIIEFNEGGMYTVRNISPGKAPDLARVEFTIKLRNQLGGTISHTRLIDTLIFKMTHQPGNCAELIEPPKNIYIKTSCKPK